MAYSRNIMFSLIFSVASLGLGGCGGGSNSAPAPTPGNCAAGQIYSTTYGCMAQGNCGPGMGQTANGGCVSVGNTTISTCQQTNQGPMVYAGPQYGCLPQGNCPINQGAYVVNGYPTCIPGQSGGATGCPANQIMTAKGCLPQGYPCEPGTGFLQGRCYPGMNGEVIPMPRKPTRTNTSQNKSNTPVYDTDDSDDTYDADSDTDNDDYVEESTYEDPTCPGVCVKVKHRRRNIKIKIKTRGRCRR